jgi:hypothetical protein
MTRSRLFKLTLPLLFATVGSAPGWAQQVIPHQGNRDCALANQLVVAGAANKTEVTFFRQLGEDLLVAVRKGPIATAETELILCSTSGDRVVARIPVRGQPRAAGGDWVFISEPFQGKSVGHLLNVRTGEETKLEFKGGIFGVALDGARLAVLTAQDPANPYGSAILQVYDCPTRQAVGEVTLDVSPMFSDLYFASVDRLLMVRGGSVSVTSVSLEDGVRAQTPVTLNGSEIDSLLKWTQNQRVPQNGRVVPVLLGAYVPSPDGNDMFFIAGPRSAEGLHLAKFDRSGKQLETYRVQVDIATSRQLMLSPLAISGTSDAIVIGSREGKAFVFARPQ